MFDLGQLFKGADTVQRHLAAPLARPRLAYLGHRAEQGAKPSTLRGIAALQVNLVRYLELGEDRKVAPAEVEAAAQRWVSQDPARRGGDAEGIRRRFLSQATCWLRFAGRLQVPAAPSHPHATEVAVFVEHMRRERGWSEATIRYRRSRADEFLRRFCRGNRTLADITVEAVDCALSDKETPGRTHPHPRHHPEPRGRSAGVLPLRRGPRLVPSGFGGNDHIAPRLQGCDPARRAVRGGSGAPACDDRG